MTMKKLTDIEIMQNSESDAGAVLAAASGWETALRKELNENIELAEWGIANEKLGGNVVKEEFWKGQHIAFRKILGWLENESPNDKLSHGPANNQNYEQRKQT
jgi:hypothetical protein